MYYVSTRGQAPKLGFEDVLLAGLACDGGLYVPDAWPAFSTEEIAALAGLSYVDAAAHIIQPFVGDDVGADELAEILTDAYAAFSHPAVAPLIQIAPDRWILELFHGPTAAFKDVGARFLAACFERTHAEASRPLTVLVATSGDTGGAVAAVAPPQTTSAKLLLGLGF